jgi:hypothetical protein
MWTEQEIYLLKDQYGKLPMNWFVDIFNKTEEEIKNKIAELDLKYEPVKRIYKYVYKKEYHIRWKEKINNDIKLLTKYRLIVIFNCMKARCYDKKHWAYKWYGGRGIKICEEWLKDRSKFIDWAVNQGYKPGLTIDKKNNNKDYSPDNCQWLTKRENSIKGSK